MTDTIELLETIGRDASLRHASSEHLVQALTALHASEGLKQAAFSGDNSRLMQELGPLTDPPPVHSPTNGGCVEDESDGTDEDRQDQGDDNDGKDAQLES